MLYYCTDMISRNHWANYITAARILGVGLIFWLTPFTSRRVQIITIIIYTIVSLTDLLDGWVARKLKTESDFGKILDRSYRVSLCLLDGFLTTHK